MTEKQGKMDAVAKEKWLAALRSGKFKQGDGSLFCREDHTYCCLGVLRRVEGLRGSEDSEGEFLKYVQATRLGLTYDTQVKLAKLNDSDTSFPEIADYIEKTL